jgi:hypothetical protein
MTDGKDEINNTALGTAPAPPGRFCSDLLCDLPVNYNNLHWTERRTVREEYIKRQNGICSHCGHPLNGEPNSNITKKKIDEKLFPPSFFKWPVHLHHHHRTGMTIGAVHNYCNAVLWQYHGE